MHKISSFLTLRPLRLCVEFPPAKPQRQQRIYLTAFFLLLAAYCFPLTAHAQSTGSAKGKIRDLKGSAISGASITARQNSNDVKTVRSNSNGEFIIDGLANGVYSFVFDAKGYASAVKYNVEVKRNKTVNLGDNLTLRIDRGTLVIIQGSVFFKDGTSVSGAKVGIEKLSADGTTRSFPAVYTNIYGEFVFRQPEGAAKFRFTAKYKDKTASKEIEVDAASVYRMAINLDIGR